MSSLFSRVSQRKPSAPLTPEQKAMVEKWLGLAEWRIRELVPPDRLVNGGWAFLRSDCHAAMVRAAQLWSADQGEFSTYAVIWIDSRIRSFLRFGRRKSWETSFSQLGNGDDFTPETTVADDAPDPAQPSIWDECQRHLDSRSYYILTETIRHGRTLQDVGDELKLTKERIRQLQAAALLRLRDKLSSAIDLA